jgi:hypothetical protein
MTDLDQMAIDMLSDDNPMVSWDDQANALAELMEPEDIAIMLLSCISGDKLTLIPVAIAAAYRDRVLSTHKRLLLAAIEKQGENRE